MQSVCGPDKFCFQYLLTFNSSSSSAIRRSNILRSWCHANVREGGVQTEAMYRSIEERPQKSSENRWGSGLSGEEIASTDSRGGHSEADEATNKKHVTSSAVKHYLSLQLQQGWTVTEALLSLLDTENLLISSLRLCAKNIIKLTSTFSPSVAF